MVFHSFIFLVIKIELHR